MYGILLVVILVLTGGVIAFIGDRLGTKVGKKKLSLFGMRPRHTSILVTIITGILITTTTLGVLAVASKDVRTALFGMEKLRTEMLNTQRYLDETTNALTSVKSDLETAKKENETAQSELKSSQQELAQAKSAADTLRREQAQLQAKNQDLWSSNQQLMDHNDQLLLANSSLTDTNRVLQGDNDKLKSDNVGLEKLNDDLRQGIEDMREKPIVYRIGELLASGVVKKTNDPVQIQNDLGQIVALANSKVVDRLGENTKDGVWIYPAAYQQAIEAIQHASGDTVVRLIVAANLVKGDPVLTDLDLHPNRIVYSKDEFVYQKQYQLAGDSSSEQLIGDFLRNVNMIAVEQGILPNPLSGTVGVISGSQLYSLEKSLQGVKGDMVFTAYAVNDTDVLGPLRLNIVLSRPGEEDDANDGQQ